MSCHIWPYTWEIIIAIMHLYSCGMVEWYRCGDFFPEHLRVVQYLRMPELLSHWCWWSTGDLAQGFCVTIPKWQEVWAQSRHFITCILNFGRNCVLTPCLFPSFSHLCQTSILLLVHVFLNLTHILPLETLCRISDCSNMPSISLWLSFPALATTSLCSCRQD